MSSRRGGGRAKGGKIDREHAREAARNKIKALKAPPMIEQIGAAAGDEPIDLLAQARYTQYAAQLAKVKLLTPLSDGERFALAKCLSTVDFQGGEAIITQGDQADSMCVRSCAR